ncbi:MAG: hypothetical protein ACUVX8_05570 [Candidatus Zipacnadales bacterium]
MAPSRDADIEARIQRLEAVTGKRIIVRPVRSRCQCFRGRLTEKAQYIVLEYRDDVPGYFWHHDILHELLDCIEEGRGQQITLYDGDVQYVEVPLHRTRKRPRPSQ